MGERDQITDSGKIVRLGELVANGPPVPRSHHRQQHYCLSVLCCTVCTVLYRTVRLACVRTSTAACSKKLRYENGLQREGRTPDTLGVNNHLCIWAMKRNSTTLNTRNLGEQHAEHCKPSPNNQRRAACHRGTSTIISPCDTSILVCLLLPPPKIITKST